MTVIAPSGRAKAQKKTNKGFSETVKRCHVSFRPKGEILFRSLTFVRDDNRRALQGWIKVPYTI